MLDDYGNNLMLLQFFSFEMIFKCKVHILGHLKYEIW